MFFVGIPTGPCVQSNSSRSNSEEVNNYLQPNGQMLRSICELTKQTGDLIQFLNLCKSTAALSFHLLRNGFHHRIIRLPFLVSPKIQEICNSLKVLQKHLHLFSELLAPPKLSYPTGSLDEHVNAHFVRSALGFLRSSTYVRDIIDWDPRPHPFYSYQPLYQFAKQVGFPDFEFDPSKTLDTLLWVRESSPDFERSLRALYNSGGIIS